MPELPVPDQRRRWRLAKAVAVVAGAAVVLAACSSAAPSAAKKKVKHDSGGISSTTTTLAPGATTTTTSGSSHSSSGGSGSSGSGNKSSNSGGSGSSSGPCSSSAPGGVLGGSCDTSSPAMQLTGAGSNSIAPFFSSVFYSYNQSNHNVSVNYNPAGSGTGVADIKANSVDFGDSEVPIATPASGNGGAILQLPVDLGGVAISYNVSGAPNNLQITGAQLAEIYSSTTNLYWDTFFSNGSLPHELIKPVYRSDTSGPGYDLDQYLIDTSLSWASAVSNNPSTSWPSYGKGANSSGQQLNTGVATYISETEGAIGYVEYAYAQEAGFTDAALQNASDSYVSPSSSSIAAAGAEASNLSASNFNIVNGTGSAYPLANFSWTLVYQTQPNTNQGIVLGKLFDWVTTTGQGQAQKLGYSPLPSNAVSLAHSTLLELQTSSGQKIFSS